MAHFYRSLAKIVLVYAAVHPVLYLGAQYVLQQRLEARFASVYEGLPSTGDGKPDVIGQAKDQALVQNLVLALFMTLGLATMAAIFHIAAAVTEMSARTEPAAAPSGR